MSTTEISNLQTEISNLKNMYNLLLDNYSKLKDDNQLLTQRIMKLETNTTQHKPLFSDITKKSILPNANELNILNAIEKERSQKDRKENNVVIFGLDQGSDNASTEENVIKLFRKLNVPEAIKIKKCYQTKSKENGNKNKTLPIIVELSNKTEVLTVLRTSKFLKEINNDLKSRIIINKDLTVAQRCNLKQLITERNQLNAKLKENCGFRYGIRDEQIKKILFNKN